MERPEAIRVAKMLLFIVLEKLLRSVSFSADVVDPSSKQDIETQDIEQTVHLSAWVSLLVPLCAVLLLAYRFDSLSLWSAVCPPCSRT